MKEVSVQEDENEWVRQLVSDRTCDKDRRLQRHKHMEYAIRICVLVTKGKNIILHASKADYQARAACVTVAI